MGDSPLHRLADYGQSVWVDSLSRDMIHDGELARLIIPLLLNISHSILHGF